MAQFNFTLENDAALTELQKHTNRSNKADVVRDALSLYQYLVKCTEDGDRIYW